MEQAVVTGIVVNRDEAKISALGVPGRCGLARKILGAVADASIEVGVIIQNMNKDGKTDFSFTVHCNDYARTMDLLQEKVVPTLGVQELVGDTTICAVSIAGIGMHSTVGMACKMFSTLERRGHQHPDDLHVRNQDLGVDRRKVRRIGRAKPAQSIRARPASRTRLPETAQKWGIIVGLET